MRSVAFIVFLLIVVNNFAYSEKVEILRNKATKRITEIAEKLDGFVGIAVKDLKDGFTYFYNETEIFPQASSIKIPILLEVFKQVEEGNLRFEEFIVLKKEIKVGGSGILQNLGEPSLSISIKDLCTLMIVLSDNTATNILIEKVGMDSVNKRMESIGLRNTRLNRKMMDINASKQGKENISTPLEMMMLLEKIWKAEILKEPYRGEFLKILSIPKDSYLKRGISDKTPIASKPGALPGVRCESGIFLLEGRPFILCVMTTFLKNDEDGEIFISEISRTMFVIFSKIEASNFYGRVIERIK